MTAVELQINTTKLAGSRLAVKLEIPAERCQSSFDEAISRLTRSVKLPGFRQGKVPKAVILQQIGIARIHATALEQLIDVAWREALQQNSIEALSEPKLKGGFEALVQSFNPTQPLSLTLETDIEPTPKLNATRGADFFGTNRLSAKTKSRPEGGIFWDQ